MKLQLHPHAGSFVISLVIGFGLLISTQAYPATKVKPKKRPTPLTSTVPTANYNVTKPIALAPAISSPAPVMITDEKPTRVIDFRFHPLYLGQMITDHETLAAGRLDVDFLAAERFSFGPSVIYHRGMTPGTTGSMVDQTNLEMGLLFNEHLTGTTSTGGIVLREHAYFIDASADVTNSAGSTSTSTGSSPGIRAGAELVYQTILKCGLSFEVGGGFTYHVLPYSIDYAGATSLTPSNTISPTISLGVGWAFSGCFPAALRPGMDFPGSIPGFKMLFYSFLSQATNEEIPA